MDRVSRIVQEQGSPGCIAHVIGDVVGEAVNVLMAEGVRPRVANAMIRALSGRNCGRRREGSRAVSVVVVVAGAGRQQQARPDVSIRGLVGLAGSIRVGLKAEYGLFGVDGGGPEPRELRINLIAIKARLRDVRSVALSPLSSVQSSRYHISGSGGGRQASWLGKNKGWRNSWGE